MATKIVEPPQSIGRLLNFASGRTNALCAKLLEPYGLSLPQWAILSCLWRNGSLTVSALADLVGTGLPATSRIIDRMVDRGLVSRRTHESDRRTIVVQVTELGNRMDHLSDFHERINDALLAGFSEEDRKKSYELLSRMQENAEKAAS